MAKKKSTARKTAPTAKSKARPGAKAGSKSSKSVKTTKGKATSPKRSTAKSTAKPAKKAAKPSPAVKRAGKTAKPVKKVAKKAVRPVAAPPSKKKVAKKAVVKSPGSKPAKQAPVKKAVVPAPVRQAKPAPAPAPVPPAARKAPPKVSKLEKVQMEFMVRSTPNTLFELISSPSGFSEWYCNDVNMRDDQWTFIWPDEEEATTMIGRRQGELMRFHRNDDDDENSYFEFRIRIDAMTNEVALIVTDHAEPHEVDETRNLWQSQIANLIRVLGA
jgi:hypothetical protein